MNLTNATSVTINGKEVKKIQLNGQIVYEQIQMILSANKEYILTDETVTVNLESNLIDKEVELFKVINMTRTSMGTETTDENGQATWTYTGTGAGDVKFVAVYDNNESNTVMIDDYVPSASSVVLSASASRILYGDSITLYADVDDQHGQYIHSGTVTFKANGTSIGTGSINGGRATLTTRNLSAGSQIITAEIGSAVSNAVNVEVIREAITMELLGDSFSTNTSSPFTCTGQVFVDWGDNTGVEEYTGGTLSHTYSSTNFRTIKVYGDITGLEDSFIYNVIGLMSITLSDGITSLGDNCIELCPDLRGITLPTTLTSIGYECFRYTSVLTSITLPNSLTSIGEACFAGGTGLTEIVLEWDTASSIVTYDSSWIAGCSSFDHFLIPEGITSLYTAKGYPSALLQEQGSVEPDSIDLTGTKSILSYADNESSVLTATVLDENDDPIEGASVSIYKDNTLWYTDTTDSNGEISNTYTSAGVGDVTFEARVAKVGSFLTKTFDVEDCRDYQELTDNTKQSRWTIPSGVSSSYSSNGWKVGNASSYVSFYLETLISNPSSIEFQFNDYDIHYSDVPDFRVVDTNKANPIQILNMQQNNPNIIFCGESTSHTIVKGATYRIEIYSDSAKLYENDVLIKTVSKTFHQTMKLRSTTGTQRYMVIKDLKIKPL